MPDKVQVKPPDKVDGARKQPPKEIKRPKTGPPQTKAEANRLLRDARGLEAQLEWGQARKIYERIAQGKHRRARGLVGLAKVAFETKQTDDAIRYAREALAAGAGDSARMILGHAYFKKASYAKAIEYYEAVLEHNPKHKEAQQSLREARKRAGQ